MRYESRNKKLNRQPGTVKNWIYRRGDIYLANLNPFKGSEQGGTRPVLVLSNDIGNFYSTLITIAPITSQLKKVEQPTHVLLENVALGVLSVRTFDVCRSVCALRRRWRV